MEGGTEELEGWRWWTCSSIRRGIYSVQLMHFLQIKLTAWAKREFCKKFQHDDPVHMTAFQHQTLQTHSQNGRLDWIILNYLWCGCHSNCQPHRRCMLFSVLHIFTTALCIGHYWLHSGLAVLNDQQEDKHIQSLPNPGSSEAYAGRMQISHTDPQSGWVRGNNTLWVGPSLIHWRPVWAFIWDGKKQGNCSHGHYIYTIRLYNNPRATLSADVYHPVTHRHRDSCCPHCPHMSAIPWRGDTAEW